MKYYGDLIREVRQGGDGAYWYALVGPPSKLLKEATRVYVKACNKHYDRTGSVSFPGKVTMRLGLRRSQRRKS